MMPAGLWYRPAYYGTAERRDGRDRGRGARGARGRRHDRRQHAGRARGARPRCRRVPRAHLHLRLRQAAGRPRALRCSPDDRPARHRRRRRLPPRRATGSTSRRRPRGVDARLPVDAALERASGGSTSTSPTSPPPMPASTSPAPAPRQVLERLDGDIDLSARRPSPIWPCRAAALAGIPVRLLRVGFVGELGYEIHCPASLRRGAVGPAGGGRHAISASGPSASRRSASCGWRRATSSSARTPTA